MLGFASNRLCGRAFVTAFGSPEQVLHAVRTRCRVSVDAIVCIEDTVSLTRGKLLVMGERDETVVIEGVSFVVVEPEVRVHTPVYY